MENASKALIIAGAILLSILIIGIGVYIYNNAAGTIKKANMSSQEIQQYNEPFETYGGTNVSGTQAMALCDAVKTHDLSNQQDLTKQIEVTTNDYSTTTSAASEDKSFTATATTIKATLRSGFTYKITFAYDTTTGYVTKVGIVKNN